MSTLTADPTTTSSAATSPSTTEVNSTFAGVMRGEWIKLLSLRSTWWALTSTAALMTLASVAYAMSLNAMAEDPVTVPGIAQIYGAEIVASGFPFRMLIIAVMGALCITGEYSTEMVRSTFAAVPTRLPVLAAKALTLVVLAAAVALVSVTLSYLVTMAQLPQYDLVPALGDPGTWRVLGGAAYCLTAAALFALGIGTLLRSTPATVTVALTVLLLLPGTLSFITLTGCRPSSATCPCRRPQRRSQPGRPMCRVPSSPHTRAWVVVAAYAVISLVAAAVALGRRDA